MERSNVWLINRHKVFILGGILFSLILVYISSLIATERTSTSSRASSGGVGGVFSVENSYLFASPVKASANGTSIIRVTVFVLDNQGLGVANQKVSLNVNGAISVNQTQPMTDQLGKAIFDVTSINPGNYTLTALVSDTVLPQQVSVVFE